MDYIYDAPFADRFVCNGELEWHDFYYINPEGTDESAYVYQLNRTGMEWQCPSLFQVERSQRTPCCEIFCILAGKGTLFYRGETYVLHKDQVVFLNSHEAHSYTSDADEPLGMSWIEFLGSDSRRIMEQLIERYSPVAMGEIFQKVSQEIGLLQQHLMSTPGYEPSVDIYRLLFQLLYMSNAAPVKNCPDSSIPWKLAESYVQTHLKETIRNTSLAEICGVSLPYFMKCFRGRYQLTPQQYIQKQRILKARYLLTRTKLSISAITEQLGFCNDSHFIRVFKKSEGMTPHCYRRLYSAPKKIPFDF